jgi:histidinol-phosphate aminotransferase
MLRPCFQHLGTIKRQRIVMPPVVDMRLSRLEKPEPWPAELIDLIRETMPLETLQQYPDYPPFYEALSDFLGVPSEKIVVGAGSEELIRMLMFIAADPGQKIAILWPTCAMYEVYARAFGLQVVKIVTDPNRPPTIDDIIAQITPDVRLVFIPNPGQPVETCYSPAELTRLANYCAISETVLVIDEAYRGFGAMTAYYLTDTFENVAILQTFSKGFGCASLRVGYSIAGKTLTTALNAVRQSGEVSAFSMYIVTVLMQHFDQYVEPSRAEIRKARDILKVKIKMLLGLKAWGRYANHVLIEFPSKGCAAKVTKALNARGIHVKSNFPAPIDRHMLVTCGSPKLMERFFENLKECCE